MRAGGENGKHIEVLILGYPSNPQNLIDDPENKREIKSCQEYTSQVPSKLIPGVSRRAGQFKINLEQHKYLLEVEGNYLFVVQDGPLGLIIHTKSLTAREIEKKFKITKRKITKHHYCSLNWKKVVIL